MSESCEKPTIVVIGAGIIGITSAYRIRELIQKYGRKSYDVVLVAREFPSLLMSTSSPNYASMWAGAHVRPEPASDEQRSREAKWLKFTTRVLKKQVEEEPWAGITALPGVEHIGISEERYEAAYTNADVFLAETGLDEWQKLGKDELPEDMKYGFSYKTFCINSPVYCMNLLRKFVLNGGKIMEKSLASEWEAFRLVDNAKLVVNASGVGFGDSNCFPTKGQTCLVANPCSKTITQQNTDGTWTFIIPRGFNGGTVIGGTKVPHDWSTKPSLEIRNELLQKAAKMYPEILNERGEFDVITDIIGRRPTRLGGMRIEIESRSIEGGENQRVVHAYGAGGRGYEMSWGVAEDVKELVESILD